jgi:peroxiredoxin
VAILEAAREVFTERGYARATIREIARRAGVTHGLVMRHFGTKEQLLIEALPGPRVLAGVLPGDLGTLPDRVAAAFVEETEAAGSEHAAVALIRSAASGEAVAMPLYAAMEREITAAFREVLGPGTEAYADLLGSLLIGVTFARHVARTGALAELTREELVGYLVPAIRALLAPAIAAAEGPAAGPISPANSQPGPVQLSWVSVWCFWVHNRDVVTQLMVVPSDVGRLAVRGGHAMRADIRPGGIFPDYSLPDHVGTVRKLSELQGRDPLILTLARGNYCPKEHQQHLELAANYPKIAVAYTQVATIATDDHHTLQEFRASVGAQWTFLSDPGRTVQQDLDIQEYTDPEHNPMIPHTLVLKPGLVVHSVYNGYWFWGRPSFYDLWRDLRAATAESRPDWDLSAPGLREAWDAGDYSKFHGWDRQSSESMPTSYT